jgi:hypothetical protein
VAYSQYEPYEEYEYPAVACFVCELIPRNTATAASRVDDMALQDLLDKIASQFNSCHELIDVGEAGMLEPQLNKKLSKTKTTWWDKKKTKNIPRKPHKTWIPFGTRHSILP